MLIFIDLDGTLVDTTHPSWSSYRDGQKDVDINQVPVFRGAKEFLSFFRNTGNTIVLVSDSHPKYVDKFKLFFGLDGIALADKPNTERLMSFVNSRNDLQEIMQNKPNCFFIGDTKLDIEVGRKLGIRTILLTQYAVLDENIDRRNGIGDEQGSKKMGPTYYAKNFSEVTLILNTPETSLLSIESVFSGYVSHKAVRFSDIRYRDGSFGLVRCLARQEQGVCDSYARADKYYQISNNNRPAAFLKALADGVKFYLDDVVNHAEYSWDIFSYLTDKSTTQPRNKMKEIFDLVETTIPKQTLFYWIEEGQGSLRERNRYQERQEFLNKYLKVIEPIDLKGKNLVILDDQLTTGATAFYAIKKLREFGARNVLFIAMFQMILPVFNGKKCPRCGEELLIKMRRDNGNRFYSCTPPKFGGKGCGYTENID